MTLPRALLVVLVLALLLTGAASVVSLLREPPRPRLTAGVVPEQPDPVALLHAWDARRAQAWANGDRAALRALYVPGASAGQRDVEMLRAWRRRGLRVEDLRMQVLAVRVLVRSERRAVLLVTDRLAGGTALGAGVSASLPRDRATTRRIALRTVAGVWRVAAVRLRRGRCAARR